MFNAYVYKLVFSDFQEAPFGRVYTAENKQSKEIRLLKLTKNTEGATVFGNTYAEDFFELPPTEALNQYILSEIDDANANRIISTEQDTFARILRPEKLYVQLVNSVLDITVTRSNLQLPACWMWPFLTKCRELSGSSSITLSDPNLDALWIEIFNREKRGEKWKRESN